MTSDRKNNRPDPNARDMNENRLERNSSAPNDLPDSKEDREKLQPEETFIDLPDVKDIPGQEFVNAPPIGSLGDTSISLTSFSSFLSLVIVKTLPFNSILKSSLFIPGAAISTSKLSAVSLMFTKGMLVLVDELLFIPQFQRSLEKKSSNRLRPGKNSFLLTIFKYS